MKLSMIESVDIKSFEVGQILYEQEMYRSSCHVDINFYQVLRIGKKFVTLKRLEAYEYDDNDGRDTFHYFYSKSLPRVGNMVMSFESYLRSGRFVGWHRHEKEVFRLLDFPVFRWKVWDGTAIEGRYDRGA